MPTYDDIKTIVKYIFIVWNGEPLQKYVYRFTVKGLTFRSDSS